MPKRSALYGVVTVTQMRRHVEDGLTDVEIGKMYYVSPTTVSKYRDKHGIAKHRAKVVRDVGQYYRMKECLLTDEQVAYIWNMSRRALTEWKKREGIDGVALQTVDYYADGEPVQEVIQRKERGA